MNDLVEREDFMIYMDLNYHKYIESNEIVQIISHDLLELHMLKTCSCFEKTSLFFDEY